MSADDIVNVQIVLKSKATTAAGFGRCMFAAYHTKWPARHKLYSAASGLSDMLTDGFLTTDKVYRDVQAHLSQKPAPKDFVIGRRALPFTQIINLIPSVTTQGFIYSGEVEGVAWTYTVGAAATVATVSTGIATALSIIGITSLMTASGASATWCACTTTTAGRVLRYTNTVPELRIANVTTDPGIATDLTAIRNSSNDWFGLVLDSQSKAEVLAAAASIETMRKVMFYSTPDYAAKDGASTTDVMYMAKASAYFNSMGEWHHDVGGQLAAASMGYWLVLQVGATTLAHANIIGVAPSDTAPNGSRWISDAEQAAVIAKNGNTYVTLGSQGDLFPTKVAGGDFVDNVRNIHFMTARIQEIYITAFQQPGGAFRQTNKGIAEAGTMLLNLLQSWTKRPYFMLDDDPLYAPTVETPTIADLSAADKANQHLPNVAFGARMTGAIILIDVRGSVTI